MRQIKHLVLAIILAALAPAAFADTTIDDTNKYAWGANVGWLNFQGDVTNGASFGKNYATGFIWGANIGWINLGDGSPGDTIHYSNVSADDFGVNVDSNSDATFAFLSGYAWGANVGWINFDVVAQVGEPNRPRIEKSTGTLFGYVWGANIGWISLNSDPTATVQTDGSVFLASSDGWMMK